MIHADFNANQLNSCASFTSMQEIQHGTDFGIYFQRSFLTLRAVCAAAAADYSPDKRGAADRAGLSLMAVDLDVWCVPVVLSLRPEIVLV